MEKNHTVRALLCLVLLCISSMAMSQTRTITGRVVSADDNMGIPFANVMARGTTIGVISDLEGHYSIDVPENVTHLEFSFLGFRSEIREIGANRTIDVTLSSDVVGLDEVVVVGFGTQRRSHLTGAVARVSEEQLRDAPVSRLDQALIGRVAGLNVSTTSSEAGADPVIRVRGISSISAGSAPLVVVDGVPMADGLSFIDPQDVESIDILKDAASTAIFGSRGANGVILITTRRGEVARPRYSFSMTQGFRWAYQTNDRLTYTEYVTKLFRERDLRRIDPQFIMEADRVLSISNWPDANGFRDPNRIQISNVHNMTSAYILENHIVGFATDAEDWVLRNAAWNQSYNLSVSGGTRELRYLLSANISNDQGIMRNSDFNRIGLRARIDARLSNHVTVGVNLNPNFSERQMPYQQLQDFTRWWSMIPIFHTEATAAFTGQPVGSYAHPAHFPTGLLYEGVMPDGSVGSTVSGRPSSSGQLSPFWRFDNGYLSRRDYRIPASAYIEITFLEGLSFRSTQSIFAHFGDQTDWRNRGWEPGADNRGIFLTRQRIEFLSENIMTFNRTINRVHDINVVAGVTYQRINFQESRIEGWNFPSDNVRTLNQATRRDPAGTWTRRNPASILASYLARGTYAFRDRYLASASIRADGSSRFGPENRWGWFPALSVGWRICQEDFMLPTREWLDQLRVRVSWGITGNDDIAALAFENLLLTSNYELGSTIQPGVGPYAHAIGNPRIGWEQTSEWNYGLDVSFFQGRIGFSLDYYYAITDGLLLQQPTMSFTGSNVFWNNIGAVRNRGVEVELQTVNVSQRNFRWSTSLNFSTNQNKLLSLGGELLIPITTGDFDQYRSIVGQTPIQFFGFRTDGVWRSQAEIDAAVAAGRNTEGTSLVNDVPGGLRVTDANGNINVVIDNNSRTTLGNPFPRFTWGINNSFSGWGFDLSFLLQGVQGLSIYNDDVRYNENMRTSRRMVENRWISPNNPGDGLTPNFETGTGVHQAMTDWAIQNGSFIALRNVTLGYTLPRQIAQRFSLRSVRVHVSAENLLYLWNIGHNSVTPYMGINPEARAGVGGRGANPLIDGFQRGAFPIQSSLIFGLNINF
ncbi:MAG: TonB-dependent receptor [Bacteroidales bacterium]|nr:TonB-dependent receptor [Bacteroidales bacterium]